MKPIVFLIIFCLVSTYGLAQFGALGTNYNKSFLDSTKRIHSYTEAGTFIATTSTMPFWLRANQYGIVPDNAPIITLRSGVYQEYNRLRPKKYDWGFGIDAAMNVGTSNKIYLPEAYLKIKLNKFEFYAGRRREIVGLVDTALTSGSYIWSGNALPIPKIQLSISDFLPLKFTNGIVAIKGAFAHGWFDNQGVIKNYYLHQKSFYARFGKPTWRIKMLAGFNHQVQWGGTPSIPLPTTDTKGNLIFSDMPYPSSFKDYMYVVTGYSLNKLSADQQSTYAGNDAFNRIGNHLGSIDLGMEIAFEKFDIFIYRQNIYDTGSLFYLSSIADGLNGIVWKNKKIHPQKGFYVKKILVEYLYTVNQGGNLAFDAPISELRGRVNYFDNSQYLNGWSYSSQIIGTPFITKNQSFIPLQNDIIYNNRVSLIQLGIKGKINTTDFEAKFSNSKNIGKYSNPFNKSQFSSLISAFLPLRNNYQLKLSSAFDIGSLYPNSTGIFVGIRKTN